MTKKNLKNFHSNCSFPWQFFFHFTNTLFFFFFHDFVICHCSKCCKSNCVKVPTKNGWRRKPHFILFSCASQSFFLLHKALRHTVICIFGGTVLSFVHQCWIHEKNDNIFGYKLKIDLFINLTKRVQKQTNQCAKRIQRNIRWTKLIYANVLRITFIGREKLSKT